MATETQSSDDDKKKRKGADGPGLKPIPALAAWYASQHVQQQEGIGAKASAGLAILWPILQYKNLDDTTTPWLHAVTLQIQAAHQESSDAAFNFVQAAKWAVEPDSPPLVKARVQFPVKDVQVAMQIRGPVVVKQQTARARPEAEAMQAGMDASDGVGATKATDGGRAQVLELIHQDAPKRLSNRQAIGYARVTDSDPCYFCALLASQGAVYYGNDSFDQSNSRVREVKWSSNKDKGTRRAFIGDGLAKVHDHCQCTLRPVYSLSDTHDERAQYFLDQWEKHSEGLSGKAAMKNYRNNYVPPPPYSNVLDLSERRQIVEDVQNNRDALLASGFRADSPNVKFLDSSISKLSIA